MVRRYFLAWCVVTSCLVSGHPPAYGLLGQTFHLKPDITGQPDEILWKHNGNKVVEFDGKEEQVYDKHQNRVTLDWVTAELDIADLRYDDSGEYELEAYMDKKLHHFRYKLLVIGKVPKPTISCDLNNSSTKTHGTQAMLTCSVNPTPTQSVMTYKWLSHGNMLLGPKLTINVEDEHADEIHTCMVSNPLTNETATFTSKSCYSGPSAALVPSLVIIIILVLSVALGIVFCRLKRKACFAKKNKDEEQQLPADTLEESTPLCDQASTLPSHQRLKHFQDHDMDLQDQTPQKGYVKRLIDIYEPKCSPQDTGTGLEKNADKDEKAKSFCQDQDNLTTRNSGNISEMEPDPAGVLDFSKDTESNVELFLEQPESEKEEDENKEAKTPPANGISPPTADICPPLTQNSPDMRNEKGANSDQVNGETSEENVKESDSTAAAKSTESDNFSEEEQLSSTPERRSSETALQDSNLSQDEMLTCKDNQHDMDKTVSEDKGESDHESNREEIETEECLYLDTSQQPLQSPTKTHDSKTDDFEEPLNTDHADPDQELENIGRHKSEESEEQSACSAANLEKAEGECTTEENDKERGEECGPKEEKTGSHNLSEGKER